MNINISEIIQYFFIYFTITAILSYIILAIISVFENGHYIKKNSFVNYNDILSSSISPSISIIAPAFNDTLNIVENVRSLL
ncbi:MAG: hypothetical protein PHC28_06345 [Flavobacterium sp.]|uniref:hypothetical protein n=1 Tax=Flavobacterium sp. TaxID=239 RepID=UPI00262BA9CD|nr:hypothetical protein [Flavobacterium sp.]MDD5150090.1 hypothetical protein [Flavobacterium sp.]